MKYLVMWLPLKWDGNFSIFYEPEKTESEKFIRNSGKRKYHNFKNGSKVI